MKVDGKLYRRQYNYSTQEWIGEWGTLLDAKKMMTYFFKSSFF